MSSLEQDRMCEYWRCENCHCKTLGWYCDHCHDAKFNSMGHWLIEDF